MTGRNKIPRRFIDRKAPARVIQLDDAVGIITSSIRSVSIDEQNGEKTIYDSGPMVRDLIEGRPERIRALLPSIRTTLHRYEGPSLPRISVPTLVKGIDLGRLISSRKENGIVYKQSSEVKVFSKRLLRSRLFGEGLELRAGTSAIFSFRGPECDRGKLTFTGKQAGRLIAFKDNSTIILDEEFGVVDSLRTINIPKNAGSFVIQALGGIEHLARDISPDSGAITLSMATDNLFSAGFDSDSFLIQLHPTKYLGRGCVVSVDKINRGKPQQEGKRSMLACEVMQGVEKLGLSIPGKSGVLILLLTGKSFPSVEISSLGEIMANLQLLTVESHGVWTMTYDISSLNSDEAGLKQIEVSIPKESQILAAAAVKGEFEHWCTEAEMKRWSELVEEGPLSPKGCLIVNWSRQLHSEKDSKQELIEREALPRDEKKNRDSEENVNRKIDQKRKQKATKKKTESVR
jgi:hypothetical protein